MLVQISQFINCAVAGNAKIFVGFFDDAQENNLRRRCLRNLLLLHLHRTEHGCLLMHQQKSWLVDLAIRCLAFSEAGATDFLRARPLEVDDIAGEGVENRRKILWTPF